MLVILDINGTLADSTFKKREGCKEDYRLRSKYIYKRPHLDTFLDYLFSLEDCQVGVWTSCVKENAKAIVDVLFKDCKLAFVLSRDSCDPVPGPGFKTVKDLRKVWKIHPDLWGPHNTIILEDSPDKIALQPENLFLITEYLANAPDGKDDRELLRVIDHLRELRSKGFIEGNEAPAGKGKSCGCTDPPTQKDHCQILNSASKI